MKNTNSVVVESLRESSGTRRLAVAEMEDELDHCEAPWACPETCYTACAGCVKKKTEVEKNGTDCETREEK